MALSDQFGEVGLKLQPAKEPFAGNDRIFGLDIQGDKFRAWVPPHVIATVQARDHKMHQVVLTVKEPVTTFQIEVNKFEVQRTDRVIREIPNPRSGRQDRVLVERKTVDETRHFLCGVDERNHPFIARLSSGVSSIQAAHELLKPPELRGKRVKGYGKNYKTKGNGTVTRQGEWFFEKASEEELEKVLELVAKSGTQKKVPVAATRGNPHTVDELVRVPAWTGKKGRNWPAATYVQGKLRHAEHETLEFRDWMRVYKNLEAGGATAGASWVD
jgi:hypothetical protein